MGGNRIGGLKTTKKIKKTDPDFYRKIGTAGGSAPHQKPRGFAAMPLEKRMAASSAGGKVGGKWSSKRKKFLT